MLGISKRFFVGGMVEASFKGRLPRTFLISNSLKDPSAWDAPRKPFNYFHSLALVHPQIRSFRGLFANRSALFLAPDEFLVNFRYV